MKAIIVVSSLKVRQIGPFLVIEEQVVAAVIEPEPDEVRE